MTHKLWGHFFKVEIKIKEDKIDEATRKAVHVQQNVYLKNYFGHNSPDEMLNLKPAQSLKPAQITARVVKTNSGQSKILKTFTEDDESGLHSMSQSQFLDKFFKKNPRSQPTSRPSSRGSVASSKNSSSTRLSKKSDEREVLTFCSRILKFENSVITKVAKKKFIVNWLRITYCNIHFIWKFDKISKTEISSYVHSLLKRLDTYD